MVESVRGHASGSTRQRYLAEQALAALASAGAQPPTLTTLALRLRVSAGHLGDTFGAATGRTWPKLVADARVHATRALLADDTLLVREIARRIGLPSPRALARLVR